MTKYLCIWDLLSPKTGLVKTKEMWGMYTHTKLKLISWKQQGKWASFLLWRCGVISMHPQAVRCHRLTSSWQSVQIWGRSLLHFFSLFFYDEHQSFGILATGHKHEHRPQRFPILSNNPANSFEILLEGEGWEQMLETHWWFTLLAMELFFSPRQGTSHCWTLDGWGLQVA